MLLCCCAAVWWSAPSTVAWPNCCIPAVARPYSLSVCCVGISRSDLVCVFCRARGWFSICVYGGAQVQGESSSVLQPHSHSF